MRSGGREMRFTTVHRRLRTVTEDTEEDGVSLTQRREEDAKGCGTEGVKGENKYGLLPCPHVKEARWSGRDKRGDHELFSS